MVGIASVTSTNDVCMLGLHFLVYVQVRFPTVATGIPLAISCASFPKAVALPRNSEGNRSKLGVLNRNLHTFSDPSENHTIQLRRKSLIQLCH